MTPLRWERIRQSDSAELWKLDKPNADGRGTSAFYRGRRFDLKDGERSKQDDEAKFTDLAQALAWFERYKGN